jgi:hypothetical protein
MILQIGAATDGNISHSFVELYNNTNDSIDLGSYSLQYAAGTKVASGETEDGDWVKIDLTGKTIQAGHSFLVLGKKGTMTGPALSITDNYGDINDGDFELSNRAVKVALMSNQTLLTVQNPFDTDGSGTKAAGYVDMIGVINDNTDQIFGYEGTTAPDGTGLRITKQVGVRRSSLSDTDDNSADFAGFTYSSASAADIEIKRPKNHAYGAWNPITGEQKE